MEANEKIQLIAELIKKYVESGYCIEQFIGKPISWFDEEKTKELIENKNLWKTNLSKWQR